LNGGVMGEQADKLRTAVAAITDDADLQALHDYLFLMMNKYTTAVSGQVKQVRAVIIRYKLAGEVE
jgi:hypothetical protein